jgi:hypothetical protein
MSDTSEGEGWWVASDGKWYAPARHADPGHRARFAQAPPRPPPAPVDPIPSAPPTAAPVEPPQSPPPAAPITPVAQPTQGRGLLARPAAWIIGIGSLVGLAAVLILFVFSGDDDTTNDQTSADDVADLDEPSSSDNGNGTSGATNTDEQTSDNSSASDNAIPDDIGTQDQPVAFGEVYLWDEWGGSIIEILDVGAAGLIGDFNDPAGEGNMYVGVIYEATYIGTGLTGIEPFLLDSPNTTIVDSFACFLEPEPLLAIGIEPNLFELIQGQTALLIDCLEVPIDDVDNMMISMNNVSEFGDDIVFATSGADLPDLPAAPTPDQYDISPLGTVLAIGDWTASVTEITDGFDAGLISNLSTAPRDGYTYIVVRYDVTYGGSLQEEFVPHTISGLGSAVFNSFNSCFLDTEAATAAGIDADVFNLSANESATMGACLEVPVAEVSTLVIRLEDPFSFEDGEPVLYAAGYQ